METKDEQIKILAQAVFEIRVLLSHHLGDIHKPASSEKSAAHLAYALHNDALAIIEDRPLDFKVPETMETIKHINNLLGGNFAQNFEEHLDENGT